MFALGILLLAIHKKMNGNNSRRNDLAALFSLFLLIFIKLYVFVLIFPGIIAWLLTKGKSIRFSITTFFSIYLIYFLCAFNLHYLFPDYNFAELLYWKQHNFYVIAEVNGANSVLKFRV